MDCADEADLRTGKNKNNGEIQGSFAALKDDGEEQTTAKYRDPSLRSRMTAKNKQLRNAGILRCAALEGQDDGERQNRHASARGTSAMRRNG
jgi:hypothetical protein